MRIKQVHIQTLFDLQIEKYFSDIPSTYKIHLWIFATGPEAETVNTKSFLRINHELVHKESFYWKKSTWNMSFDLQKRYRSHSVAKFVYAFSVEMKTF